MSPIHLEQTNMLTAVDLFAGLGGSSEGARQAGIHVLLAANHWPLAVETHRRNHPETEHLCQDLQQANFHSWPDFDIMLASPACTGHSRARGKDRPHHDPSRSTAWSVVACAEAKRPGYLVIENVAEFLRWQLYPEWARCLAKLGYVLRTQVIDAADLGVPQHRRRLFITGVHARVSREAVVVPDTQEPHTPASAVLNMEAGSWSRVLRPGRAIATLKRWFAGRREHGHRFVMPYFGSGSGKTGRSLSRPLGTVTTRDRWALVKGGYMRMLMTEENRLAMGFRPDYVLPGNHKLATFLLGNAVCPPVARHVLEAVVAHHISHS